MMSHNENMKRHYSQHHAMSSATTTIKWSPGIYALHCWLLHSKEYIMRSRKQTEDKTLFGRGEKFQDLYQSSRCDNASTFRPTTCKLVNYSDMTDDSRNQMLIAHLEIETICKQNHIDEADRRRSISRESG